MDFVGDYDVSMWAYLLWLGWGKAGSGDEELEIDMYTLLYLKQMANQDLLYSMGRLALYSVIT